MILFKKNRITQKLIYSFINHSILIINIIFYIKFTYKIRNLQKSKDLNRMRSILKNFQRDYKKLQIFVYYNFLFLIIYLVI